MFKLLVCGVRDPRFEAGPRHFDLKDCQTDVIFKYENPTNQTTLLTNTYVDL